MISKLLTFAIVFLTLLLNFTSPKVAFADSFSLSGTVKDNTGAGINGVTVDVYSPGTTTDVVPSTVTNQSGDYSFSSIPQGTYDIKFTPPTNSNVSPITENNVSIVSNVTLNVQLSAVFHTYSGTVTDQNGNPIQGLGVTLANTAKSQENYSAKTNASGQFSISAVADTYNELQFSYPLSGATVNGNKLYISLQSFSANEDLTSGDVNQNFGLNLVPITVVTKNGSGTPVSGITVTGGGSGSVSLNNISFSQNGQINGTTDSTGSLTGLVIQGTSFSPGSICASSLGVCNTSSFTDQDGTTIILSQTSFHTYSGIVTDQDGNPVQGMSVNLINTAKSQENYSAKTNASGQFSISAVADTYNELQLASSDFGTTTVNGAKIYISLKSFNANEDLTNNDITQNFNLNLVPLTVLTKDGSGAPVSGITVSGGGSGSVTLNNITFSQNGQINGATDSTGSLIISVLEGTTFTSGSICAQSLGVCNTSSLTDSNGATVTLSQPTFHIYTGTVSDQNGNPVQGLKVNLVNTAKSQENYNATTNASGQFSISALADTYNELRLFSPDMGGATVNGAKTYISLQSFSTNEDLTSGDVNQNFSLNLVPITVVTKNSSGTPVSGISISGGGSGSVTLNNISFSQSGQINGATDSTGSLTDLILQGTSFSTGSICVQNFSICNTDSVTDSSASYIIFQQNLGAFVDSPPATTATLSTPFSDGLYPDPTTVTLSATAATGYTIANTYYTIDGGAQQTYTVPFTVTGSGSHTITYWSVDNAGAQEAANTKTFTITEAYTLNGTVYIDANQNGVQDPGENGYANATVTLNTGQTATTDSNGTYSFPTTESGSYVETLTVPVGYLATTTNPVNVALAADTTVNFGIALPMPTPTPTQAPTATVTFDDINPVAPLNGNYSGINWGTNSWDVDSTIATDNTHSASFHSSSATSETFSFTSPQVLISTGIYSNSNQPALITLACSGNPTVSQQVSAGGIATLTTNWITPCTTVTVTSSNGWNTNLDNLVYAASSNANPTPTPTPSGQILGNNTIGSQIDTGDTGFMNGSKFLTGTTGGPAQSMSVFVGNIDNATHSQYQMAIYTDNNGTPGTLIASTATGNLTALSWNTLPITATLTANTTYWLLYNTNSRAAQDLNNLYYTQGTQGAAAFKQHAFGSWPTTITGATLDTPVFSIYMTYQ